MTRPLDVVRARPEDRSGALLALAGLCAWLAYTRVFWTLHGFHTTLPACPFLAITGQPCPLCGGTRSFAAMWDGDPGRAIHYHPLGPLLFFGTFAAAGAAALLALSGRALRVRAGVEKAGYVVALAAFAAAWAARLAFLPLPPSP